MIRLLTTRPDGSRVIDVLDPANPSFIAELLRLDGPVQAAARTATEDQLVSTPKL
jgi:cytochrome P450